MMRLSEGILCQVFKLNLNNRVNLNQFSDLNNFVFITKEKIKIIGDQSGEVKLYIFYKDGYLFISFNLYNLLTNTDLLSITKFQINKNSIKEILSVGLISSCYTFLENVYVLGIGDVLLIEKFKEKWEIRTSIEFPYFNFLNKENSIPSTKKLKFLITNSLSKRINSPDKTILMLSSGKDSSGLAIGLAAANMKKVRCITFSTEDINDEVQVASKITSKLGLKHEVVKLNQDKIVIKKNFLRFFEKTQYPCIDNAIIPYVLCLAQTEQSYENVIDGMGNDIFFGHVPSRKALLKMHLHRLIYKNIYNILERFISRTSNFSYFKKYKTQLVVPGKYFKLSELEKIFSNEAYNFCDWKKLDQVLKSYDVFDFRAVTRGRYYDQNVAMLKAECASRYNNANTIFPWCDDELIKYVFNLPETYKFDRKKLKNKILLRMMLNEEIDYDYLQDKKVGFYLNTVKFVSDNENFIKDEIYSCKLWKKTVKNLIENDFSKLINTPKISYSIISLFLVSGWYNHSPCIKYVKD